MSSVKEMSPDEMMYVNGGVGGSPDPLPDRPGYVCYRIQPGDNLIHLAKKYKTSVDDLFDANRKYISLRSDITKGYYMYIPDIPE